MAIQFPPGSANATAGPSTPTPHYRLAQSLTGHSRAVTALKFSSDGRVLVSAGADGVVHVWGARTGEHQRSIRCHRTGINDLSLSPDNLYLATASDDKSAVIHLLSPGPTQQSPSNYTSSSRRVSPLRVLSVHTAPVLAVAFSPKSNLLVTGSYDESAIVWDVRRGAALRTLPAHADAVWSVGWDPEGVMVLTGSADGLIRLWDASTGQCLKTLDNETNSPVSFATFTPSSYFLLSSTLSSTVRVYNIHTSKVVKTLRAPGYVSEKYPCPAIVFSPPDALVHTNGTGEPTSLDVLVNAYDDDMERRGEPLAGDGPLAANGNGHVAAPVQAERKRGKEAWVVAGSETGKAFIWELGSKRVVQVLGEEGANDGMNGSAASHDRPIVALAVSPDGRTIATGSLEPEKVIHIWRTS